MFEGGGVRGIGHVGAACRLEEAGYRFAGLAGSSAGAIVAALLAAGYRCKELKQEMETLDYMKFRGAEFVDYFGAAGKALSIFFTLGIYNTKYLKNWVEGMLLKKGVKTFGDLRGSGRTLRITASDLTDRKLLLFPDDLPSLGLDPEAFSVAEAVRMSVSIPVYFEPVRLKDGSGRVHMIVDGGLLSNYPISMFEGYEKETAISTLGFQFSGEEEGRPPADGAGENIVEYLKSIVSTCLGAVDRSRISASDLSRTIKIPARVKTRQGFRYVNATDFDIGREESLALFENGRKAAEEFLHRLEGHAV